MIILLIINYDLVDLADYFARDIISKNTLIFP